MANDDSAPSHVTLERVTLRYERRAAAALEDVTFSVAEGARVAVVGPNGAGKSTLFKALAGLLPVAAGRLLVHGALPGAHKECVAYVPQREEVDWRFPVTVFDVVMMGRYGRLGWFRRASRPDREAVQRSLEQLGLTPLARRPIGELSGGQQQRVFLARALAQEPHILIMDEPFTGVDATTQNAILDVLETLKARRITVLVSTHDLRLAASRFERVALLNRRLIAYGAPAEVFTAPALTEAFGGQMLMLPGGALVADHCCPPPERETVAEAG